MPTIKPEISTASDANSRVPKERPPALVASDLAQAAVSNALSAKTSEPSANENGSTSKKDFFERLPEELRGLILQEVTSRPDRNALRATNRALSAMVDLQEPDHLKNLATWSVSNIFAIKKILSRHIDLIALSKSLGIFNPIHHNTGHLNVQMADIHSSLGVAHLLIKNAAQISHFVFPQDYRVGHYIPSTALGLFPSTQPESLDISGCSWLYGPQAIRSAAQLSQFKSLTSLAVCAGDLSQLNVALFNKPHLQILKISNLAHCYYPHENVNNIRQCVNIQTLTSLTTLNLHDYPLNDVNIKFIVDHLSFWPNLSSLSLAEKKNTISEQPSRNITEDLIEQSRANNLKELHLYSEGEGDDFCKLIRGAEKLRTLTLNISNNDRATKSLFESLSSIETLQNFRFSGGTKNPVEIAKNIKKLASLVLLKNLDYNLCDGWNEEEDEEESVDLTSLLSTLASLPHLERLTLFSSQAEIFDISMDHEAYRTMPEFIALTHLRIRSFAFYAWGTRRLITPNFFAKMPKLHTLDSDWGFLNDYGKTDEIVQSVRTLKYSSWAMGADKGELKAFPNLRTLQLERFCGSELEEQNSHGPVIFDGIRTIRVDLLDELFVSRTSSEFPDVCKLEFSVVLNRSLDFSNIPDLLQRFPALQYISVRSSPSQPQNEFEAYFNGIKDAFQVKPNIKVIKVFKHRSLFGASNCKTTEKFWSGGYWGER